MAKEGEQSLLIQAISGKQAALERLLLAYAGRLRRRIGRKLPSFLRSTVGEEDILQEVFIDVFRRIRFFEGRGELSFYRWLVTIAEHRMQDAVKAQLAAKRGGRLVVSSPVNTSCSSADGLIDLLAAFAHTPSQSVAGHEVIDAVQVGLASLKEDYRQAIELRHIRGRTVAETATVMNRSPDAVKNLCRRGLKELHVVLGRSSQYFSRT